MKSARIAILVAVATACLTACAVGPRYRRPDAPLPESYREAGADWQPATPASAAANVPWWEQFGDPVLNDLQSRIDVSNQSLKSALAAYAASRAVLDQTRASYWPTVSVSAGQTRSARGAAPAVNVKNAAASASWEPDIWGKIRRSVEAARASAAASEDDLAATRLSLQATLATDYFELRVQDRIQILLDTTVKGEQQALQIAQNRYKAGVAARADVVTAQTQLLSVQAQQLNAGILRAQLEHAIAILVGAPPGQFTLAKAELPNALPVVPAEVPSALLQRRPDVAAAERQMAAANAQIGVAESAWFPSLALNGSLSYSNAIVPQLISLPNRIWSVGPTLAETLFDGGARRAKTAQARASYDQSVAQYRQSVLTALQQVEDALVNLRILAEQAGVEDELVKSAHEAELLTLNQYKAGTVPYSSVISAQTATLSAEQSALQVVRSRYTETVSLVSALGGDWRVSATR
jgi:NodT family efflux transporter outer membrane factor (OMF) lipoprotein